MKRPYLIGLLLSAVIAAALTCVPLKERYTGRSVSVTVLPKLSYVSNDRPLPNICAVMGMSAYKSYTGWPFRTADGFDTCDRVTTIYIIDIVLNVVLAVAIGGTIVVVAKRIKREKS